MASTEDKPGLLYVVGGRLLAGYIRIVRATSRRIDEPADLVTRLYAENPFIFAMWHGQFMMLPTINPGGIKVKIMVARHGDAEILGQALLRFDMELIRGAGAGSRQRDRGGAQALRQAVRCLSEGATLAMTTDVPPGPARKAGLGIVTLARLTGRPIIPCAMATSRYVALNTWSRFTINLPFSRLGVVLGEPILVPRTASEAELEAIRLKVEAAMNATTARAYALAGADPARATPRPKTDADSAPRAPGAVLGLYRLATRLVGVASPLLLRQRQRNGKEDPARLGERSGIASRPRPAGRLAWLHAASVGEMNSILPVMSRLAAERPDLKLLLTTGTLTSARLAAERLGPEALHQFVPLDVPRFVTRFLDHWRPDIAIFAESEIWPNLVLESAGRGIPLMLVNARMSKTSFRNWRRSPKSAAAVFGRFTHVLAQSEKLARRFSELGARRVTDAGNLKIDAPPPRANPDALAALKAATAGRPILLAASTHDGEESIVAAAHRRLAAEVAGLLTIIVPRHPERGAAVTALIAAQGLAVARRSEGQLPAASTEVYVADTLGELGTFYALAPVAFIGGSLVDRGGQNPIEAIRHGAAVLIGPHWQNFADACEVLIRQRALIEVKSGEELASAAARLLRDESETSGMRTRATAAIDALGGSLERTVATLLGHIARQEEPLRAAP